MDSLGVHPNEEGVESVHDLSNGWTQQESREGNDAYPTAPNTGGLHHPEVSGAYSMQPDLKIIIDGETLPVYSQVLMNASPVFEKMLSMKMSEGTGGQVELPGKIMAEFKVFWEVLGTRANLTDENAEFLSMWADEYQLQGLQDRCDVYIVEHLPVDCASLEHAITYNLPRRATQCYDCISTNIRKHVNELTFLGSGVSHETMSRLWPCICKEAAVEVEMPDGFTPGHVMWPFIAQALKYRPLLPLLIAAKGWPDHLYCKLPSGPDSRAKALLEEELKKLDL